MGQLTLNLWKYYIKENLTHLLLRLSDKCALKRSLRAYSPLATLRAVAGFGLRLEIDDIPHSVVGVKSD